MTSLNDNRPLPSPRRGALRQCLAFALTAVAFSVPIGGMFVVLWPFVLAQRSIAADGIEVISLGIVACLIGLILASHIHRERGTRQ